ncbi:FAD-dependent monooxygenase [Nonomuraea zeae]|uniref:Aromatic ring hydroxylase n=1 Tax=Nonomuraea zeae TaxID=1642303 RepID=A0A5S4GYX3_9ACTN|nr:FAD-dependent monooxygenase [Nonomuraea zeae]TMR37872.1 aromatic ring hydroxylase [Nonomuraea zeae]
MSVLHVPVLVVGGGACGLSASIFLSDLGVEHLLVERRAGTSDMPRAHYLNQRTMEIFRQHALADAVYAEAAPPEKVATVRWQTSLAGDRPFDAQTLYVMDCGGGGGLRATYEAVSPCATANLPQIRLEPLLRRHAEERAPGRVRFGHELLGWSADDRGRINAEICDRATGERLAVCCRYLVAADGGKTVGPGAGVRMVGRDDLPEVVSAYFTADLSPWWDDQALLTWFLNPGSRGVWGSGALVAAGPEWGSRCREWVLHLTQAPDAAERLDASTFAERMRELLGVPRLRPEVHRVSHWRLEAVVAERYRAGNVFLAGDAAHRHGPNTGLGLNTAVQDAHNLAWKLSAVLAGRGGEALLDTYDSERRPVGRRNVDWATAASLNHQRIVAAIGLSPDMSAAERTAVFARYLASAPAEAREAFASQRVEFQAHDLELGFAYAAGALVPDGTAAPPRDPEGGRYRPTARPGHRLPHVWLQRGGRRVSTHDLTGAGASFALITGAEGAAWQEAVRRVRADAGVAIAAAVVSGGAGVPEGVWTDPSGDWARLSGIGPDGALLVRPDNHVAWRSPGRVDDPGRALATVLECVLRRRSKDRSYSE